MELGRILLYSADELWRYVAARLKYRSACYSSSKLQWSGGILRCLNGMDCYLLFPVVIVRLLMVSEHRWLILKRWIQLLIATLNKAATHMLWWSVVSRHVIKIQEIGFKKFKVQSSGEVGLHQISWQCYYMLGTTTKLSMPFQVLGL